MQARAGVLGVVISLVTLLFGDDVYRRVCGHDLFDTSYSLLDCSTEYRAIEEARKVSEDIYAKSNRIYGPSSGSIPHEYPVEGVPYYTSRTHLSNFVAECLFMNPYDLSEGSWDYGIFFRETEPDQQYRLVVDSNRSWTLWLGINRLIASGTASPFDTKAGAGNFLRLVADGGRGFFFVNGKYVSTLNISHKIVTGEISTVSGGFYKIPGRLTRFQSFTILSYQTAR